MLKGVCDLKNLDKLTKKGDNFKSKNKIPRQVRLWLRRKSLASKALMKVKTVKGCRNLKLKIEEAEKELSRSLFKRKIEIFLSMIFSEYENAWLVALIEKPQWKPIQWEQLQWRWVTGRRQASSPTSQSATSKHDNTKKHLEMIDCCNTSQIMTDFEDDWLPHICRLGAQQQKGSPANHGMKIYFAKRILDKMCVQHQSYNG